MLLRIRNLIRKELIQLGRDVVLTAFIITLPVVQLVLLARSTSPSITGLDVAVVDRDRSSATRRAVEALDNREALDVRGFYHSIEEAGSLLDQGDAILIVVFPEGFSQGVSSTPALSRLTARPSVQVIADGSNDLIADIALGAAHEALTGFAREEAGIWRDDDLASLIDLRTAVRFNATFDVKLFTVPAQVGFIVYQVTLTVAAIGLARERELGTLEQLLVMPLTRLELVIGKALPALIIGLVNFLSMLAVAVWGFGVPMRGSVWMLLGLTVVFVIAEIGYGMFISGMAHTQQQAILLVFVLAMLDMAFSGYLVPIKNLPSTLRVIARVVPLRHYLAIMRSVMLRGAGLGDVWGHAAAMLVVGAVVTGIAVRSLSGRLD
jgi:ABC-2 type transport system permease protein